MLFHWSIIGMYSNCLDCFPLSFHNLPVQDHQKTTEIYAGHIEMGARKQTDYLVDFWQRNLVDSDSVTTIPAIIKGGN